MVSQIVDVLSFIQEGTPLWSLEFSITDLKASRFCKTLTYSPTAEWTFELVCHFSTYIYLASYFLFQREKINNILYKKVLSYRLVAFLVLPIVMQWNRSESNPLSKCMLGLGYSTKPLNHECLASEGRISVKMWYSNLCYSNSNTIWQRNKTEKKHKWEDRTLV